MSNVFVPAPQPENVVRGTLFAALIIPAGVILWVVIWNFGVIASLVAFAVAIGTSFLYRFGSRGLIGLTGAVIIAGITVLTLGLGFFAGMVSEVATAFATYLGSDPLSVFTSPNFWDAFAETVNSSEYQAHILPQAGFAVLLGGLGCFSVLRRVFMTSTAVAPAPVQPAEGVVQVNDQALEPDPK